MAALTVSIGGIIGGIIVAVVFIIVLVIGCMKQNKAKAMDASLFGEFPTSSIVFHVLITIFLAIGLVLVGNTIGSALLGVAGFLYLIKICTVCCSNPELDAFRNQRSAQQTDAFLQKLRCTMPQAYFSIECYHMHTYTTRDSNGHVTTHTEKVVTFRETRYVNITGVIDSTPALYIRGSAPLVLLSLRQQVSWLGNSQYILNAMRAMAYQQNCFRDVYCSVGFNVHVPGLTPENFLQRGQYPAWISPGMLKLSILLQFDCLYICFMRSAIPHTYLPVIKACSLEQYVMVNNVYQLAQPVSQPDQIQLPSFDDFCTPNVDQIALPPILEENKEPLITEIRPPYIDTFDQIKPPTYDAYTGPAGNQNQQTVQNQQQMQQQQQYQDQQQYQQAPMNGTGNMMLQPATAEGQMGMQQMNMQ
ncbi:Transmembrane_domain-containing protein [Hexamita inflata]|uniref:Transmembrane domain-containing protein n=1 Tax=Hexamita inflata TaxID=28002 RepID=A0AA86TJJ1_9EUKA|nr:Transmembrane domain-containing protein [Hexamita inflata]